jgi:TIR domain
MSSNPPVKQPIEILFSYAHEDEALRDKLEKHLSTLKRQNRIVCWYDRNIRAGTTWNKAVSTHLDTAHIILLLVSADFLDSDYCNTVEVKRALQRHRKGEACVIPVILRKCDWHNEKFAELQALPRDARPVVSWPNQDDALYDVAVGIKKVVEELEKI